MSNKKTYLRLCHLGIASSLIFMTSAVVAQTEPPNPNPLEITTPDPLLPKIKRPLSRLERSIIEEKVQELNQQATGLLQAGKDEEAFVIWYRELRLQRALGTLPEIQALGRIGAIAWEKNRKPDVKIITDRLNVIWLETQTKGEIKPEMLLDFGQAYQQLKNIDKTLEIYEKILLFARQQQDILAQEAALKVLGQFYLAKFDYVKAAEVYEQLLTIARSQSNYFDESIYLTQLADIYGQISQPENSIAVKQKLADQHLKNKQLDKLAALKISIGDDYEALNQPEESSQNYQQAFEMAWSLKQFATASEALIKLGDLYHNHQQNSYALEVYQQLLKVEQQSYNLYGLMNAYDRIGKIYLEEKNYNQALTAFQKGLEIATSLNYDQAYFTNQIVQTKEQINQQNNNVVN